MGKSYIHGHKERYRRGQNVVFSPNSPKTLQKIGVFYGFWGKGYMYYIKSCNFVIENVIVFSFYYISQKLQDYIDISIYTYRELFLFTMSHILSNWQKQYPRAHMCMYSFLCNFVTFNDLTGVKFGYISVTKLHRGM